MQTRHHTNSGIAAIAASAAIAAIAAIAALGLTAYPFTPALAHGELDAGHVAEFHRHLDDYKEEIGELTAEIGAIASDPPAGDGAGAAVDELVEHWEEVGVHAAIERKATVTYPDIWQALVAFRQAVEQERGPAAVRAAADDLQAALWQGYGALRLAASRVRDNTD